MTIKEHLFNSYKNHKKARTTRHQSYPERFPVGDSCISWDCSLKEYFPVPYTAPLVLNENTTWADKETIPDLNRRYESFTGMIKKDAEGYPLNPFGRTGICRRGVLGKWGPNFAVDGLLTRAHPELHVLQVLVIQRKDTGEWAIPGGMVDPGESPLNTRNRELAEELSLHENDFSSNAYEEKVFEGYVDDPRNTDNAWMETTVIHTHMEFNKTFKFNLQAGDDAKGFRWIDINIYSLQNFYASHGFFMMLGIEKMLSWNPRNLSPFVVEKMAFLNTGDFS